MTLIPILHNCGLCPAHPSPHSASVLRCRPLPPWVSRPLPPYPCQARCPPSLHCTLSTIPASHAMRRLVTLAPSLCHDTVLSVLNVTTRTPVPLGTWPGSYLLRANGGAFFSPASPTPDPSPSHPRHSQPLTGVTTCAVTVGDRSSLPAIPDSTRTHNTPPPL